MTRNRFVIDTNVPIAANGRNTHADEQCQLNCINFLDEIRTKSIVLLDNEDFLFDEYKKYLSFHGEPGVGDKFFKYLYDNMYKAEKIMLTSITKSDDEARGFEELPPNTLDPSDRKFLATAVVGNGTIVNALDSDWDEQADLLDDLGVSVVNKCAHQV